MMRLIRWGPMAVADFVAEFFETDLLRAAVAARGIFGAALGPWSAGSTALLLLRAAADPYPVGNSAIPRGGMGALTAAMAASAKQAGAEIRTERRSSKNPGEERRRNRRRALKRRRNRRKVRRFRRRPAPHLARPARSGPSAAKFCREDAAFSRAGNCRETESRARRLAHFHRAQAIIRRQCRSSAGRIHIGPGIDYLERAFDASKYGEFSPAPYLDISIPSLLDSSLAPAGKHVMSIYMQFAPLQTEAGDWTQHSDALADTIVKTLAEYAPDLQSKILGGQIITPKDLEDTYGLTGGHPFHGELALDQIFTMRPLLGWARYATPVKGLYLCGSGTHPGNGVTGASGANAAREILRALKK